MAFFASQAGFFAREGSDSAHELYDSSVEEMIVRQGIVPSSHPNPGIGASAFGNLPAAQLDQPFAGLFLDAQNVGFLATWATSWPGVNGMQVPPRLRSDNNMMSHLYLDGTQS